MQMHDSMGLSKELPIECIFPSRLLRIIEGGAEIHRMQFAYFRLVPWLYTKGLPA
jgi:alkylation response protein AidB-like acyl-CoA dehydrogenase